MSKSKSNKHVKQMICDVMKNKHDMDFWFDDGCLMYYEPPCWTFEGDEYAWLFFGKVSVKASELRGES